MDEYGIWDNEAGGFIATGYHGVWGRGQASADIKATLAGETPIEGGDAEAAEEWEVLEICPDHEEQPKNGCEECDSEDVVEEDTDDDEE